MSISHAIRACALLFVAMLLAALAIWHGEDITLWLSSLFFLGLGVLVICCIPLSHKQKEQEERRRREIRQREREAFTTQRASIEQMLHAGQLLRLEEWWEDDELWVDENAHLHFIFSNGKELDFILYAETAHDISQMLAPHGINWQATYRAKAGSHLIWPQQ